MATLVARQSEHAFVGREPELQFLGELARGGGETRVVQLDGVAGIGKSALLDAFLERARHDDVAIVRLDCRSIEPTDAVVQQVVVGPGGFTGWHTHPGPAIVMRPTTPLAPGRGTRRARSSSTGATGTSISGATKARRTPSSG
jgi:hypothetical protein